MGGAGGGIGGTSPVQGGAVLASLPAGSAAFVSRVRFAFTADEELVLLVRRARELLRHKYSDGRLERIFKDALLALLEKKDPDRQLLAAVPRPPRPTRPIRLRSIPEWVKDAVRRRDGGRCAYFPEGGRPCGSRDGLEFDHVKPWALGGSSDDPANIRLLCGAHNRHLGRRMFGDGRGGGGKNPRPAEKAEPSSPSPAGS